MKNKFDVGQEVFVKHIGKCLVSRVLKSTSGVYKYILEKNGESFLAKEEEIVM